MNVSKVIVTIQTFEGSECTVNIMEFSKDKAPDRNRTMDAAAAMAGLARTLLAGMAFGEHEPMEHADAKAMEDQP